MELDLDFKNVDHIKRKPISFISSEKVFLCSWLLFSRKRMRTEERQYAVPIAGKGLKLDTLYVTATLFSTSSSGF